MTTVDEYLKTYERGGFETMAAMVRQVISDQTQLDPLDPWHAYYRLEQMHRASHMKFRLDPALFIQIWREHEELVVQRWESAAFGKS